MLKKIFPGNPPKATAYRDVRTEKKLLEVFKGWAKDETGKDMCQFPYCDFYRDLLDELVVDFEVVKKEHDEFKYTLKDLEKLKTEYLNMDGNLEGVRAKIQKGEDIFTDHPGGEDALSKYTSVLENIPRMMIDNITTWERNWLGSDDKPNMRAMEALSLYQSKNDMIRWCSDLFTPKYFGAQQALIQYLHLVWRRFT